MAKVTKLVFPLLAILITCIDCGQVQKGGPLDGTWKVSGIKCEGISVVPISLIGFKWYWTFRNGSLSTEGSQQGCSWQTSQIISYLADGKFMRTVASLSDSPSKCLQNKGMLNLDPPSNTKDTFTYSLSGDNLILSETGNEDCSVYGKTGPIQYSAIKQ